MRSPTRATKTSSYKSCTKTKTSSTIDLILLILVLISCTFLITSSLSSLLHTLSLLDIPLSLSTFSLFFILSLSSFLLCAPRRRKCGRRDCRGMKDAVEFDLQIQGEDAAEGWKEVDGLPWKGGVEDHPDYVCLREELRKMAPVNGRAVLLFRKKCGCPVSKIVASGPKKRKRHNYNNNNNNNNK